MERLSRRCQWSKNKFKAVSGKSGGPQFVYISERLDERPRHDKQVSQREWQKAPGIEPVNATRE
jgi:hypothetical protein